MLNRRAGESRLPLALFILAVLAGLALLFAFARFNTLHEEFLRANFDSVHGARTLLKSRHALGQAEERLGRASENPGERSRHLKETLANLELAESYGAEGHDDDPRIRSDLVARIRSLRDDLADQQVQASDAGLAAAIAAVQRLTDDFEAAELERWGNLASLNATLGQRMEQLRLFIVGSVLSFALLMGVLAWALLRTRRAEAALRQAKAEAEAIQQTTLDAAPLGIAYVDAGEEGERRLLRVNRQMASMLGYEPGELVGLRTAELYPDNTTQVQFSEKLLPALRRGETVRLEGQMRRRNGEVFWAAGSGKAVDATDLSRGIVWAVEDISVRKATEAELQAAREKAEAANRTKDDFLASMSQALRPPFTGILHLLDRLAESPLDERQQSILQQTRDRTRQLQATVNDVLDLSLLEAGKLELAPCDFDAGQLFDELARRHAATAAVKDLAFAVKTEGDLPRWLRGDPARLRQIADQLIGNALKFTARGRVDLTVSCQPAAQKRWRLRLEVRDTGGGLSLEQQSRIFERLPPPGPGETRSGAGVGLALCQQLAPLLQGRLEVQSLPGIGSRFCFEAVFALGEPVDELTLRRHAMNDPVAVPIHQQLHHR